MFFSIILLLSLDLRILAYGQESLGNQVKVVDYNTMGQGVCPHTKQPLCATNGQKFVSFENRCQLEVTNYQQLIQGLQEFYECPLSYCSSQCAPCALMHEPVCAIDIQSQQQETFANPCEVERKTCLTQKVYSIISAGTCPRSSGYKLKCPKFCTLKYNPICAQYQNEIKKFPNECELQNDICETNKDWQITDSSNCNFITDNNLREPAIRSNCHEYCSSEYKPICARLMSLEKEFSNECELQKTICQTKQEWTIIKHGPCLEAEEETVVLLKSKQTQCPHVCTICAKLDGELREFANNCDLQSAICETHEQWEVVYNGSCSSYISKCPQVCTLECSPICAELDGEFREFANNCDLQSTLCQTQKEWVIVNKGPCFIKTDQKFPICPQFCSKENAPVCAKFNTTLREFANICVLVKTICESDQKWKLVHLGPCASECPKFCTKEFNPVCAKYGQELREFPNPCVLKETICETGKKWKIIRQGKCFMEDSCPKFCTKELLPVCAKFDNIVEQFPNKCILQQNICETYTPWEVVPLDLCSPTSENKTTSSIEPDSVSNGKEKKTFESIFKLRKEIQNSEVDWTIPKQDQCEVLTETASQRSTRIRHTTKTKSKTTPTPKSIDTQETRNNIATNSQITRVSTKKTSNATIITSPCATSIGNPTPTTKFKMTTNHLYDFEKSAEDYSSKNSDKHLDCSNYKSLENINSYSEESFEDELSLESEEDEEEKQYNKTLRNSKAEANVNTLTQNKKEESIFMNNTFANKETNKPEKYATNCKEFHVDYGSNNSEPNSGIVGGSSHDSKPTYLQETSKPHVEESVIDNEKENNSHSNRKADIQSKNSSATINPNLPYNNNYGSGVRNENNPKFYIYNNGAYSSGNLYQDKTKVNRNSQAFDYIKSSSLVNDIDSPEDKLQEVFEVFLAESDSEESKDDIALVNRVLTNLATEKTLTSYPIFEEQGNQLNHIKGQENISNYNTTASNKKGEIYNGPVYKAPFYDAPTYNFIYTSPNHPIFPWLAPGTLTHVPDLGNKGSQPSESVAEPNISLNIKQVLNFLATLPHSPPATKIDNPNFNNHLLTYEKHKPFYPYTAVSPFTFSYTLPQMQSMPHHMIPKSADINALTTTTATDYLNKNRDSIETNYKQIENSKNLPSYPSSFNKNPWSVQAEEYTQQHPPFHPVSKSEHKNITISPLSRTDLKPPSPHGQNLALKSKVFKRILENLKILEKRS